MTQIPTVQLGDGTAIPQLGFGTWQVPDDEVTAAVESALGLGYRHIDTAAIYGNEEGVGRAIAAAGIPRGDLYVTTKLWNDAHKKADARAGIESSLEKLGLDQVDLYLMHWPATVRYGDAYIEAWDAMQEFQAEGLAKSIGVSNFHLQHLDQLNGATPAINQIELHPTFAQVPLRTALAERGITVESWSPLGSGADLGNAELAAIAETVGKSVAQVIIRWHLQHGFVVLPKSVTPERIAQNIEVFDFDLDSAAMARIDGLDAGNRVGSNPETARF